MIPLIIIVVILFVGYLIYDYCLTKYLEKCKKSQLEKDLKRQSIVRDVYKELQDNIKEKIKSDEEAKKNEENLIISNDAMLIEEHYKNLTECIVKDAVNVSKLGYELSYTYAGSGWTCPGLHCDNEFGKYLSDKRKLSEVFFCNYYTRNDEGILLLDKKYYKVFDRLNKYLSLYNLRLRPNQVTSDNGWRTVQYRWVLLENK